jgi:predicted Zn-dependent protease
MQRLTSSMRGGGLAGVVLVSDWTSNVRWARNQISAVSDDQNNHVLVMRDIRGADNPCAVINEVTDTALVAALRRAERLLQLHPESSNSELMTRIQPEPMQTPQLFSEATFAISPDQQTAKARELIQPAVTAGMLSAGFIQAAARSIAFVTSWDHEEFDRYTWSRYSVTVRDPSGRGSGWAGLDSHDWTTIDGATLAARALEKCLTSRNPVRIEPGRYTTILEPQAVCDLIGPTILWWSGFPLAAYTEASTDLNQAPGVGSRSDPGISKLGQRIVDDRISISADPMDPDMGFPAYDVEFDRNPWLVLERYVYHNATWIRDGALNQLEYYRDVAIHDFGRNLGNPNSGAFRVNVHGSTVTVEEMIATTKRGLLVTRFDAVTQIGWAGSPIARGYTRDGLWLIEEGKISKPVMNMAFTEEGMFVLNNIDQLGSPQRVFHPRGEPVAAQPQPVIVPAMKVRDFNFTALSDAV